MNKGDGMSYAEFTYPIMQAWDWWHMYHTKGISIQIGGSDQYGNITAGISAIKYISTHHPDPVVRGEAHAVGEPLGFTSPLLTTSSGQKFGKSAGNAIWLDGEQTSPFDLYGYFLRTSDEDVGKYLKMFTFMPLEDIDALLKQHEQDPSQRKAQHYLAREILELVHGAQVAGETEIQHELMFSKQPSVSTEREGPKKQTTQVTPNNRPKPNIKLPRSVIFQRSVGKILFAAGLVESASEGHRLAQKHGAYVGGNPDKKSHEAMPDGFISWAQISNWQPETTREYLIHDDLLLLRRSKHNIRIIQVVSDQEYALSGETFPGMDKEWRMDVLRALAVKEEITAGEREAVEKLIAEEDALLDMRPEGIIQQTPPAVEVGGEEGDAEVKASANP